jgi:hypothetical protein
MPEPKLDTPPSGNLKIHAEHFRKVVRRIECIKPIAGDNITLTPTEDGIKISSAASAAPAGSAGEYSGECGFILQGYSSLFKVIQINVCSNGQPAQIAVFAPRDGRGDEGGFLCEV